MLNKKNEGTNTQKQQATQKKSTTTPSATTTTTTAQKPKQESRMKGGSFKTAFSRASLYGPRVQVTSHLKPKEKK